MRIYEILIITLLLLQFILKRVLCSVHKEKLYFTPLLFFILGFIISSSGLYWKFAFDEIEGKNGVANT